MRPLHLLFFLLILLTSCKTLINQNFEYENSISPTEVKADIDYLKKTLIKKHYDINWENNKDLIFSSLDQIGTTKSPITLDSFENRIAKIISVIDDGHSSVVHQSKIKPKPGNFGTNKIAESIHFLKIANFYESEKLFDVLVKFKSSFEKSPTEKILIDIRSNPGGTLNNVRYFLSYFLPSKTKIYDRVDLRPINPIQKLMNQITKMAINTAYRKRTNAKKLKSSPNIYLLIDDKIASGSMLASYHLQQNGAYIIGKPPKGLINMFGRSLSYKLPNSKILFTLPSMRIYQTDQVPKRMEDMLLPDYIPTEKMDINQILEYIEGL